MINKELEKVGHLQTYLQTNKVSFAPENSYLTIHIYARPCLWAVHQSIFGKKIARTKKTLDWPFQWVWRAASKKFLF